MATKMGSGGRIRILCLLRQRVWKPRSPRSHLLHPRRRFPRRRRLLCKPRYGVRNGKETTKVMSTTTVRLRTWNRHPLIIHVTLNSRTVTNCTVSPISQPSPRPRSPSRYSLTSRISISSLITVDQAAIAEFVAQQSLNTYTPNYYSTSPLTDPILFDAFRHYVEVVAPTMSLIESSPPNPTILNHHVIPSMKACNLFTYQLPIMAVSGNLAIM